MTKDKPDEVRALAAALETFGYCVTEYANGVFGVCPLPGSAGQVRYRLDAVDFRDALKQAIAIAREPCL